MSIVFAAAKNISKFHHLLANGIELAGYLDAYALKRSTVELEQLAFSI